MILNDILAYSLSFWVTFKIHFMLAFGIFFFDFVITLSVSIDPELVKRIYKQSEGTN